MKKLIAYFSRSGNNYVSGSVVNLSVGNTKIAAEFIQKTVGGDLFEIRTKKDYSEDYSVCIDEAKKELKENARPELLSLPIDLKQYDEIYLGYPNWWGTMPMAVFTFLERFDFSGKKIFPFCTNEGSGMGFSEKDIAKLCPQAVIKKGLPIHGGSVRKSENLIRSWIKDCEG